MTNAKEFAIQLAIYNPGVRLFWNKDRTVIAYKSSLEGNIKPLYRVVDDIGWFPVNFENTDSFDGVKWEPVNFM